MSKRAIVAISLLASLGGCSLFGGGSQAGFTSRDADISSYFDERLAAGRQYLVAGAPARAVTAFRQASYNAEHAAEAFNGMGVAYSMQGRPDVAQKMFNKAVAANPYDKRFSRNLARLENRLESEAMLAANEASPNAVAEAELPAVQVDQDGELPPVAKSEVFTFPQSVTSSGGLIRNAPKETHIAAMAYPATMLSANSDGMSLQQATADSSGIQPLQRATRNASVTVFKPQKNYPVRVAITGSQRKKAPPAKSAGERAAGKGYPVRVAFGQPDADERN